MRQTPEHIAKRMKSRSWWKHQTDEAKLKCSLANKGKHHSPRTEFKKGSSGFCGKHTEKTKRILSEKLKGRSIPKPNLRGKSPWNKGKKGLQVGWNKGKKMPQISGAKHPNWCGGIYKEKYSKGFWGGLKEIIRQRDNFTCQLCGCPQIECITKLMVHHIDYNKKNHNHSNLISLCNSCHTRTNHKRPFWRKYFQMRIEHRHFLTAGVLGTI